MRSTVPRRRELRDLSAPYQGSHGRGGQVFERDSEGHQKMSQLQQEYPEERRLPGHVLFTVQHQLLLAVHGGLLSGLLQVPSAAWGSGNRATRLAVVLQSSSEVLEGIPCEKGGFKASATARALASAGRILCHHIGASLQAFGAPSGTLEQSHDGSRWLLGTGLRIGLCQRCSWSLLKHEA